MPWRPHGRADVDPSRPSPFGVCDRCGFLYNLEDLVWQRQYAGVGLINLEILVCRQTCLDIPQPQLTATILPPDPAPVFNARPEYYSVDELGPTQGLQAQLAYAGASVPANFYIDLYFGNPLTTGTSILESVTGSPTRPNAGSSFAAPVENLAKNNLAIIFTTDAIASVNVDYVAAFDAATGGILLTSAPLFNPQTIVLYNGAEFDVGTLTVALT